MKKLCLALLSLVIAMSAAACGGSTSSGGSEPAPPPSASPSSGESPQSESASTPASSEQTELIVFAAASMTETLEEISKTYAEVEPGVKLVFNFDSSGTLKNQIEEGAECDLFISAGQKQMNKLDVTASAEVNTQGLDFVLKDTRIDLLENRVTLVVPKENPADLKSYDDMAAALSGGKILMAMGNSDVPVGQYAQKILTYYDLDEKALADSGVLSYGTNVKEVTTQVAEASVDCGVIYCTDAFSAGLDVVDYATAEMCGQVIYPAAVMNSGSQPEAARAFLEYLTGSEAMSVFESVGFAPVKA